MERLSERELYDGKVCFTKCSKTNCLDTCTNCDIPKEANVRLKEYEDLEEKGKLLRLPCAVGDVVYVIPSSENFGINIVNGREENNRVYEQIVDHVDMRRSGYLLITCDGMSCVNERFYKKTWFTDKKEAEVKLKELERYWKKVFQEKNKV